VSVNNELLSSFKSDLTAGMEMYPKRFIVLLIDFDDDRGRLDFVKAEIGELIDRVFILGCLSEPERLKSAGLGSYETIGQAMARDCRYDRNDTWGHALLRHNEAELMRLRERVRPILFKPH
jgi:hypothetical protein